MLREWLKRRRPSDESRERPPVEPAGGTPGGEDGATTVASQARIDSDSGFSSDSWIAIDFETASVRGTPCAVGVAVVEDGRVVAQEGWLIRPPIFEFWPMNVAVHGITPEMCEKAPDWPTSLERIRALAGGRPLVAHNAAFDIGVIRDACSICELGWPELEYVCTLVVARKLWPELSSHSLPFVAAHLQLDLDNHHDASADAIAAAQIGLKALKAQQMVSWVRLVEELKIQLGSVSAGAWTGCHSKDYKLSVPTAPSSDAEIDQRHLLYGKQIAFTGELAVRRREAQQAVVDVGGIAERGVTRRTDYLVTGFQDLTKLATGESKSAKLRKAENLRSSGQTVEIIAESEFTALLAGAPDLEVH